MRYPNHLHYCFGRCQFADSSDERRRGRVPCETVRLSAVAQNGPRGPSYVTRLTIGSNDRRFPMPEHATVTYPEGDRPDRRFERIIGKSAALESVLEQVKQVASTDSTVLIEGETGTGKDP